MLAVNTVLKYNESDGLGQRLAVLWLSPDGQWFWGLDLNNLKSWPHQVSVAESLAHLNAFDCTFDSPNAPSVNNQLSERQVEVREQRWEAMAPILENEPAIYDPKTRAALIRVAAERVGCSLNTARAFIQAYWRGGKVSAALTPGFNRRGGLGVLREPGTKKLGRPRSVHMSFTGINVNREQKRAVVAVARAQFRRDGKRMLTSCYRLWLDRFFYEDGVDAKGKAARVPRNEYATTGVPTLRQFKHAYYSLTDVIEAKRERDPRRFALSYRPLTGTATAETWGPGSRFLIDATMADIYLVSRNDRSRIVGRPVVYVVIDVWSRLIVGLYVAIEDASWTSAMMALANAACSKVAFCSEHGIEIDEEEWPAANVGARLLSDHGEVDGKTAANLALHFNRVVEAAAAYRGDLKGLVETQFNTLQVQFGQFTPGYVAKDFGRRGARDYRLDAVLDIQEFTATMIDMVLNRNSATLNNYDRDQGMPGGVVKLAPIELWHWGVQHRSGRSQVWPEEYVRFRLLPVLEVSVDRNGISFQGRSYVGPSVLQLMSRARMGERSKVKISFDPRVTDAVYLHVDDAASGFEVCTLHARSRAYAGQTALEADQDHHLMNAARRDAETEDVTRKINVARRLEARIEVAEASKPDERHVAKSQRLKDIRGNRRAEKERTKAEHGDAFRPGKAEPRDLSHGSVLPFVSPTVEDFSESSLTDFMDD